MALMAKRHIQNEGKYIWMTYMLLTWAFIGLFSSPFVMFYLVYKGWWTFFAKIAIIVIHCITLLPCGIYLFNNHTHPFQRGLFIGIMIFATLFMLCGIEHVFSNYNEFKNYIFESVDHSFDSTDGLFTFILSNILLSCIYGFILLHLFGFCFDEINKFEIIKFIFGILLSVGMIVFTNFAVSKLPSWEINKRNSIIEKENAKNLLIKSEHKNISRSLSFAGFALGANEQVITNDREWHCVNDNLKENTYFNKEKPAYIDSIFEKMIQWDNHDALVYISIAQRRIIQIVVLTTQNCDSVLRIFINKYGEPELYREKLEKNYYEYAKYRSLINTDIYSWTFKNCSITIRQDYSSIHHNFILEDGRSASMYFTPKTSIEYILSDLSSIEHDYYRKLAISDSITQKKRNDSIRDVKENEKKALEKENKIKDNNHRKAIDQI